MAAVGSKRSRAAEEEAPEVIHRCAAFVKEALAGNDASHDWRDPNPSHPTAHHC